MNILSRSRSNIAVRQGLSLNSALFRPKKLDFQQLLLLFTILFLSVLIPTTLYLAKVSAVTPPSTLGKLNYQKYQTLNLTDRSKLSINVANGNVILETNDMNVVGTGPAFNATRYYNSLSSGTGIIGSGFTLGLGPDVKITANGDGSATYQGVSGYQITFPSNGSGGYNSPPAFTQAKLAKVSGGGWTLTYNQSNEVYTFNSSGIQTKDTDKNGLSVIYNYTGSQLTSITDAQGRTITLNTYSGSNVGKITDPTGRNVTYTYTSGKLTSSKDAVGSNWGYQYTSGGKLNQITDPKSNITRINYDTSNRVSDITLNYNTSSAATYTYAYDNTNSKTTITDPLTHTTVYTYDASGRITSTKNGVNDIVSATWDTNNNQGSSTDPSTYSNTFTFNSNSSLTKTQNPNLANGTAGASTSLAFSNTAQPYLPSSRTDGQGNVASFSYNTAGNMTQSSNSNVMNMTNHIQGDDATGGNPPLRTSNAAQTAAGGSTWDCTGFKGQICRTYTDSSNVLYLYDGNGNLVQISQQTGSSDVQKNYTTDTLSRLKTYTDGNGSKVTYTYDNFDRVTNASYATGGRQFAYTYDANGNLTQVSGGSSGITKYTYDGFNRITKISQQQGTSTTYKDINYTYDKANNIKTEQGDAGTITYTYDNANQLTGINQSVTNSNYTFAYTNGKPTTITIPGGITQTITYDRAGRQASIKAVKGAVVLTDYSAVYQNTSGADTYLMQSETNNKTGIKTTYGYDGLNRLTSASQSTGTGSHNWTYAYDNDGNRTSATMDGVTKTYGYVGEQLTNVTDGDGTRTAATYDSEGNATNWSAMQGLTDTYSYNSQNQMSSVTTSGGSTYNMSYLDSGQTKRTAFGPATYTNGLLGLYNETRSGTSVSYIHIPSGNGQYIGEQIGTSTYYYLQDLHGSTVAMVDGSGNVKNTYSYDPYGSTIDSSVTIFNPIQFQNAYYEGLTGLSKMGARYYNASIGRFIQVDPSGKDFYYTFANNNPVNYSDPSGYLSKAQQTLVCVGGIISFAGAAGAFVGAGLSAASTPITTLAGAGATIGFASAGLAAVGAGVAATTQC